MHKTGAILAIAWPETRVRKVGMWYDYPLQVLGFSKNDYYIAGHAATAIIDYRTGEVHYFDFGRYHTPEKYGRVRDKYTDPELEVKTKSRINDREIENIDEIILELNNNHHTHGEGKMRVSLLKNIDFEKAYSKAKELQSHELIHYGPIDPRGTNCSRFVAIIGSAGVNNLLQKLYFKVPYTLVATPLSNIRLINSQNYHFEVKNKSIEIIYNWHKQISPELNLS